MRILDILIRIFICAVVGACSIVMGIIVGSFLETTFGRYAFWIGFAVGVCMFIFFFVEKFCKESN